MELVRTDCRHFRGDVPCTWHKRRGMHCQDCQYYEPIRKRILIIKLGAIGDVIRTTPLLRKLWKVYPDAEITWLTDFPEVVPSKVDRILRLDARSMVYLLTQTFDLLYNLDKDLAACALAEQIQSQEKFGFGLKDGKPYPLNEQAWHKYLTGVFDDISRANHKSYPQEIFEICGFTFSRERYVLDPPLKYPWSIPEPRPLIGLNTGCGDRWPTRLWPEEHWVELARKLKGAGYGVIFLGGEAEHERNYRLSRKTGGTYLGYFPIKQFISLMDQCDVVVTGVTMALHVAIGLGKKVVLFNNIFNRYEFELYGLGVIMEPPVDCTGCYKTQCEVNCMKLISPEEVFNTVQKMLR